VQSPALHRVHEDLGVRGAAKALAGVFELAANFEEVVDLAVYAIT